MQGINNMSYLDEIKKIIAEMKLSEEEREDYLKLFNDNPDYAKEIYDFYQKKQETLRLRDKQKWHNICQEEYKFLEMISKSERISPISVKSSS